MKFTQHVPGAVDLGDIPPVSFSFTILEELTTHEFIREFVTAKNFYRLSIAPHEPNFFNKSDGCLMAEFSGGKHWWVLGYIEESKQLNLPTWVPTMRS